MLNYYYMVNYKLIALVCPVEWFDPIRNVKIQLLFVMFATHMVHISHSPVILLFFFVDNIFNIWFDGVLDVRCFAHFQFWYINSITQYEFKKKISAGGLNTSHWEWCVSSSWNRCVKEKQYRKIQEYITLIKMVLHSSYAFFYVLYMLLYAGCVLMQIHNVDNFLFFCSSNLWFSNVFAPEAILSFHNGNMNDSLFMRVFVQTSRWFWINGKRTKKINITLKFGIQKK